MFSQNFLPPFQKKVTTMPNGLANNNVQRLIGKQMNKKTNRFPHSVYGDICSVTVDTQDRSLAALILEEHMFTYSRTLARPYRKAYKRNGALFPRWSNKSHAEVPAGIISRIYEFRNTPANGREHSSLRKFHDLSPTPRLSSPFSRRVRRRRCIQGKSSARYREVIARQWRADQVT